MLDSKQIGLITAFTALTVALDPIRIPYLLGIFFRLCEIPIVAAMLLFGPKIAVSIAILNVPVEIALFPGPFAFISPFFVLMLTLSMLFGIHSAIRILKNRQFQGLRNEAKKGLFITGFGALLRTLPAPLVIGFLYRFIISPVLELNLTDMRVIGMMPIFASFAVITSIYTIPVGYLIATTVGRNLKHTHFRYRFRINRVRTHFFIIKLLR